MAELSDADVCQRFRRLYLPAVCDALYMLGVPEQVLGSRLRPLFPEKPLVGFAFTIEGRAIDPPVPWDEGVERIGPYLEVFDQLTPDSVIVSVNGSSHVGHLGELTANAARAHGCVGAVLDGNLRDVHGLREIEFQVFYRDLSPLNAIGRWEMIAAQRPVAIDGVTIHPGDVVVGEFDGILVIPYAHARSVLVNAEEIVNAEALVREEMRQGGSPLESLNRHGHI